MENVTENMPEADLAAARPVSAPAPEIVNFQIRALKNHPLSDVIYGTEVGEELLESIRTLGVLQPILVVKDSMEIISGNSRVKAARILGFEMIQGTYFSSVSDLEIQQAVLESNSQRIKTNEQKIREYNARKTIEAELTILRKAAASPEVKSTKAVAREARGKARETAARKIGVSANVADKAAKVIEEADRLKDEGRMEESTVLINALNKSIKTAHKMVNRKDAPEVPPGELRTADPVPSFPVVTAATPPALLTHDDALRAAHGIVKFLRAQDSADFTTAQSEEWGRIGNALSERLRELQML